jgi:hypothetical protein
MYGAGGVRSTSWWWRNRARPSRCWCTRARTSTTRPSSTSPSRSRPAPGPSSSTVSSTRRSRDPGNPTCQRARCRCPVYDRMMISQPCRRGSSIPIRSLHALPVDCVVLCGGPCRLMCLWAVSEMASLCRGRSRVRTSTGSQPSAAAALVKPAILLVSDPSKRHHLHRHMRKPNRGHRCWGSRTVLISTSFVSHSIRLRPRYTWNRPERASRPRQPLPVDPEHDCLTKCRNRAGRLPLAGGGRQLFDVLPPHLRVGRRARGRQLPLRPQGPSGPAHPAQGMRTGSFPLTLGPNR